MADNVPWVKIYYFIIFLPLITHQRKRKLETSLYIKKKKNIRERESEKPITIGEDNTVCINQ